MKAEHRKELQTNLLADRMGRMVQRVRSKPSRRSVLWIGLGVLVVAVYIGLQWYWAEQRRANSALWRSFGQTEFLGRTGLSPWIGEDSKPAKAARFEIAWMLLWDRGIKLMAADATNAVRNIAEAEKRFSELREECKDDPILAPEAAYALALIEETRAIGDRSHLDKAIAKYKGVQTSFRDSAVGKAAGQRAEYLEKNRDQVEDFYEMASRQLLGFGMLQRHLENPRAFDKMMDKNVLNPAIK